MVFTLLNRTYIRFPFNSYLSCYTTYYNQSLSNGLYCLIPRQFSCAMAVFDQLKMHLNKPFRVSVEGNIGSGKSTLMNYFKQLHYVQCFDEPLDKWRNCQGHNLLGLLYKDLTKWNSTFQSYVQLTRIQTQNTPLREGATVQLFERSVQNNRHCFMENAFQNGFLSEPEFAVLCSWYEWLETNIDISLDLIVYLRTTPDVVFDRIQSRQRQEEKNISKEYLQSIHDAHERWLMNPDLGTPVCVIDADLNLNKVTESYDDIIPYLPQSTVSSQVLKT